MQGDFTSPLVLAPSPLASLPPCSMPTSLSEGVQVWIWGRVTQPPAGKIPCSCSSPSFSFSGCSVFEPHLLPAHLQLEENQYWESLAGPSLLPDHPLTSMTHLFAEASFGRTWGGVSSMLTMGVPAAVYCWPSSTDTPSLED
ncbi:rCG38334, isoform CRA_d [Rattus norvegicus]|uniref:RCG38334, isoform CRA_d n=1 Tax=Rattus norvegicus TaxID=10116 RepID=A6KTG8_RAT|nr:rCG38334, isoform CRA_d [Rattus norvegicus]